MPTTRAFLQIGDAEQVRGPLPGLDVFKGDIINRFPLRIGVADILEHLHAAWPDVDLVHLHPERLHQAEGVVMGLVGCRETGHRIGQHVGAGQLQPVHRPGGDDQCMGGVESPGDADHDLVDSRGLQTLGEPLNLDVVGLIAALIPLGGVRRDVGETGVFAVEEQAFAAGIQIHFDPAEPQQGLTVGEGVPAETGLPHPILGKAVQIEVGEDHPGAVHESLRFGEKVAVFTDHGVAVPGQVRRRFPGAGRGVKIGGDAPGGLVRGQAPPVFRFPDRHVGGGEVSDHGRSGQRGKGGGRDGDPDVLAHFQEKAEMADVGNIEKKVGAERDLTLAAEADGFRKRLFGGAELAALVEFPVIGEVGFNGDPDDAAAIENDSAIEQAGVDLQGRADDEDQVEGFRLAGDPLDRAEGPLEEGLLLEEVIVGIGGQAEFGKEGENGLSGPRPRGRGEWSLRR